MLCVECDARVAQLVLVGRMSAIAAYPSSDCGEVGKNTFTGPSGHGMKSK
jgi:hypothetical protein